MRKLVVTALLLGLATGALGAIQKPSPKPEGPPRESEQKETEEGEPHFGIWQQTETGRVLIGTRVIPLIPGTRFGWIVDYPGEAGTPIAWREELILADAPRYTGGASRVAPNHLVRERTSLLSDGAFDGSWMIDAWDPRGPATTRIYVDGKLVASFDFAIE
jgi:hypothetical protein